MKKRIITLTLVLMLAVGLLAPTALAKPDQLKIWVNNTPFEKDFMKEMAKKYEEKTGIEIQVTPVSLLDQTQKLSMDGPAGKGADVVCWPHDKLGKSAMMGVLEPVGKYLSDGYTDRYLDTSIEALTHNKKLWGLPYAYQTTTLIYNKDMYSEAPETWEELISKAKRLTTDDQYGFLYKVTDYYYNRAFFKGFGAYTFGKNDDDTYNIDDIGLDNPGAVEAAEFIKQFRTEGLIPKGINYDNMQGLFGEGKVGAIIDGSWAINNYKDASIDNDKIGVATMPKLPNGEYPEPFVGVKGYYLSKFSENKEAAVEFIKFLTNAENSMAHYQNSNIIVPHEEVINSDEFQNNQYLTPFVKQAERGSPMPSVPEIMQVWDPMANAITFTLQGKAPPKQVMPMVVQNIEEGIRQMRQ